MQSLAEGLSHRGPDGFGFLSLSDWGASPTLEIDTQKSVLGFMHRRLSILDLSDAGKQPLSYNDERFWITYNGEIYNYIELREELQSLGYSFSTQTDTEIILAAYQAWGKSCLHRLNGMWAFAIYDSDKNHIFLARDRFGIKPFYYWVSPDRIFYFASEIKAFSFLPDWQAELNMPRAYDFLIHGIMDHTDETMFHGVYQLRGGQSLVLKSDHLIFEPSKKLITQQWYRLTERHTGKDFEDNAKIFKDLIKDSVRIQLRSDVSVGSCLSGGLDSTTITVLMNRILKESGRPELQNTFSAISSDPRIDESQWIKTVTDKISVNSHLIKTDLKSLFENLPEIIWHQDEPFGSSSILAQWSVFNLANKKEVRVILDGQGADEYLAGYNAFYGSRFADLFLRIQWGTLFKDMKACNAKHGFSWMWMLGYLLHALFPALIIQFISKILGRLPTEHCIKPLKGYEFKSSPSVRQLSYMQLLQTNLPMLLHWEDRNSMAHSIESRVPFLDHRLVEFVLGLPDHQKIEQGVTKKILRHAMSGIIPDEIRDRKDKIGFATAEEEWIKGEGADQARQAINKAITLSNGFVNKNALDRLEMMIAGKARFDFSLWRILCFGIWLDVFKVHVPDIEK